MSFITLEDINTWIMKYIDNDEPHIHQAPIITANHSLYRGNNNPINGLITLPDDEMEYTVSYQGKPITDELYIPEDYEEDSIRLRIITKSYYPYVGVDVYIDVPVETKQLQSVDDLNTYKYGEIGEIRVYVLSEIVNDVHAFGGSIKNSNLNIKGDCTLENVSIENSIITVDGTLTLKNCELTPYPDVYLLVNNNTLNIIGCESSKAQNLIINNATCNLTDNSFSFDSKNNYPSIHSETYPNMSGNTFTFEGDKIKGYGICIIRTKEMNTSQFLSKNNTNYNCTYTNDETTYTVFGEGLAYCTIDDDTIHFTQLEVNTQ